MVFTRSDDSSIELTSDKVMASERASWPRVVIAVLVPVATATLTEVAFWSASIRWSLFYLAVFVSSWLGGFRSGVSATVLCAWIMWWYFTPPHHSLVKSDARYYLGAMIFLVMGVVISGLHRRLRRRTAQVAHALVESRGLTERLEHAIDERRVFSALIENSTDFICIYDADGKPTYVNPAGRQLIGLTPDFPIDTLHREDFYPKGLRAVPDLISHEIFEQGRWRGESRLRHWLSDQSIPVSDTQFLIRDPEGRLLGIGEIARDMSEAMRGRDDLRSANQRLSDALRDLSKSQRFLQGILDYSPNGIIIKSLDGRYLVMNHGIEKITGIRATDALGKTDFDLFPRIVAERFRANDRKVRDTRAALVTEERFQLEEHGRVVLVSKFPLLGENLAVFAIGAIWTDITDRKRSEEALRLSAHALGSAQRVAHVGSWRWDRKTETTVWSEELYHIFGRDPNLPPPRLLSPDANIFTPESAARLRAAFEKLFATGEPYELDLELIRPDGSTRWVSAHGEAVRNDKGEIIAVDGTAADISHVKTLQRMRDEWTSVIAHDLRQPIGVIAMASDFLPEIHAGQMSERERAFMDRIRNAANTLARMVDDLLDMSLLEANRLKLERKWVDPRTLVTESVERQRHTIEDAHVKVVNGQSLSPVFVDPMRIGQMLGNLLSNAVKYGDGQHDVQVHLDRHDHEIEIAVTNYGKGIEPEELPRLFDRFVRSKTTRGSGVPGLGLGLYISKGVVEAHGGRLWAESKPGDTTTFHLTLPTVVWVQEAA